MKLRITYGWDDEQASEFSIPAVYDVCSRCEGTGSHVNPSIDGHGIPGDDECWHDDDFRSMYFGGGYDVTCEECDGLRVVLVADEDLATPEQLDHYRAHLQDEWECDEIARMERAMGA